MRFDPRRAQNDETELTRSRDEMLRLQAANARPQAVGRRTTTPVSTPAFGRMHAVRTPVARAPRAAQSSRRRVVIMIALVVSAFLMGFWYANALSDGAALRQLEASEGMLPSP